MYRNDKLLIKIMSQPFFFSFCIAYINEKKKVHELVGLSKTITILKSKLLKSFDCLYSHSTKTLVLTINININSQ